MRVTLAVFNVSKTWEGEWKHSASSERRKEKRREEKRREEKRGEEKRGEEKRERRGAALKEGAAKKRSVGAMRRGEETENGVKEEQRGRSWGERGHVLWERHPLGLAVDHPKGRASAAFAIQMAVRTAGESMVLYQSADCKCHPDFDSWPPFSGAPYTGAIVPRGHPLPVSPLQAEDPTLGRQNPHAGALSHNRQ